MSAKALYSLELHQQVYINPEINILRVPGGWIYIYKKYNTNTFVPFNNEFQPVDTNISPNIGIR